MKKKIFLSPPHMGGKELDFVHQAFADNYIAPVGPQINLFEQEFAKKIGSKYAVAVNSGTAGLHLALRYAGISPGDEVLCSTFTFVATVNAIAYLGGIPVFIDSEPYSWNMDPALLAEYLLQCEKSGKFPKALLLVHLYGQPANLDLIVKLCSDYNIRLIEDSAESLGASYNSSSPGTFGLAGVFSFNGNKIITTSGGGMVVTDNKELANKIRFWATQAKENAPHYEHQEIGYNYRMSNILAAIGRGQLQVLDQRVRQKRDIFSIYKESLKDLPGVSFISEIQNSKSSHWLTCLTIDPKQTSTTRNDILKSLEVNNIESRPTWKPMHLQPLYKHLRIIGGAVSEKLFANGICLPSGTSLLKSELKEIIQIIRSCWDK